jgi:Na+-driven multidrug efflux pump
MKISLLNTLSSSVRGTGNMGLPATVMIGGALTYLALSRALMLGWGPFPRLGLAGAAGASVTAFGLGALVLMAFLLSGRCLVRLGLRGLRFRRALFWDILRVGVPGALNTVLTNLNVVLLTGLVGPFAVTARPATAWARGWNTC